MSRPVQLPSLLLIAAGAIALCSVAAIAGQAAAPTPTAHPAAIDGAIPGPTTPTATATGNRLSRPVSVSGVSQSTRTVYRTAAGRTEVTTATVTAAPRTVFATATATVTAVQTATVTATATQTVTATATVTAAATAGSTP